MKTIILILIFVSLSFAQSNMLLLMGDDITYDADAETYFNALTTPLSENRKDTINQFILMLKDSLSITNLSDFFLRLSLDATETQEASLTDIIYPDSLTTVDGTLTWTPDAGWTGSATPANRLNSNFNALTDANIGGMDDISYGITIANDILSVKYVFGAGAANYMAYRPHAADNTAYAYSYEAAGRQANGITTSVGHHILTRTSSTVSVVYKNGNLIININRTSVALINRNIYWLASNGASDGEAWECRARWISKGCSQEQARKISNCIEWYLDAIGVGVIP